MVQTITLPSILVNMLNHMLDTPCVPSVSACLACPSCPWRAPCMPLACLLIRARMSPQRAFLKAMRVPSACLLQGKSVPLVCLISKVLQTAMVEIRTDFCKCWGKKASKLLQRNLAVANFTLSFFIVTKFRRYKALETL